MNNFCLDGTDTKWDHPFIRVSYSDLYPNTFSSLQSPQYLVEVPISVREMENIYWTWNKQPSKQNQIVTSKDFEFFDLMKRWWMNVGYSSLSNTNKRLSLCSVNCVMRSKRTIFCLSLWSFMRMIWWDRYLAELRPGLFSGGELSLALLYFPQGLMWICFPSTWVHLHPKYFYKLFPLS